MAQNPDPVQQKRFARFTANGLPHPRAENWRWSDLHGAIGSVLAHDEAKNGASSLSLGTEKSVPIADCIDRAAKTDPMAQLTSALSPVAQRFDIAKTPDEPIYLRTMDERTLAGSHAQIHIAAGCHVILIEENIRLDHSLNMDLREYIIGAGGALTRVSLLPHHGEQSRFSQNFVQLDEGATYRQFSLDFGGRFSRHETHVTATGGNTNIVLNGAYLLDNTARAEHCNVVHHDHRGARTRTLCKGVVLAKAQAVFQGKFHVARTGQQTDAKMGHHCLLLSDQARVRAKPELEIYADDVACAHGNTTGALDESALFYMRQRGLPRRAARELLIKAFVGEVFDPLLGDVIHTRMMEPIETWLERHI